LTITSLYYNKKNLKVNLNCKISLLICGLRHLLSITKRAALVQKIEDIIRHRTRSIGMIEGSETNIGYVDSSLTCIDWQPGRGGATVHRSLDGLRTKLR